MLVEMQMVRFLFIGDTKPGPYLRFPGTYEVKLTILRISSDFASFQSAVDTGTITVNAA